MSCNIHTVAYGVTGKLPLNTFVRRELPSNHITIYMKYTQIHNLEY